MLVLEAMSKLIAADTDQLKQTVSLQRVSSTSFTGSVLEYFVSFVMLYCEKNSDLLNALTY